jgi:hypothetical protein
MPRLLFVRSLFAGDQRIVHRRNFPVLIVAMNFCCSVHEERSLARPSVSLRRGRELKIVIIPIRVRRNAVAKNIAALFSGRHISRHQRSLLRRDLILRRRAKLRQRFRQFSKRALLTPYRLGQRAQIGNRCVLARRQIRRRPLFRQLRHVEQN